MCFYQIPHSDESLKIQSQCCSIQIIKIKYNVLINQTKILKALKNPKLIAIYFNRKFEHYYKTNSHKGKLSQEFANWFNDFGDETLRLEYPLTSESVVFDLGGYKGDFAFEIHRKYNCFVYVFEPVQKFYGDCVERFRGNDKVKIFPYGLSNVTTFAFISDEADASTVVRNHSHESEKIWLMEFAEVFEKLDIKCINLLKINVEGSEFLIVPHLIQSGLIGRIDNIQVQFHTFYPNAKLRRKIIRRRLSKTHTEKWNYPFVWESWARK